MKETYSETEEQIFGAALKVFSQKGKDGARMQEIADEAGINKALLHYYFRSKDRLYDEVFTYVMQRFMGAFSRVLGEAETFEELLRRFVDSYIDFVEQNLDVVRLFVNENLSGGTRLGDGVRALMASGAPAPPRLFFERMAEAVERGEIRPADPVHTLITTLSACLFPFIAFPTFSALHPPFAEDRPAFLAARKQHVFEVIFRGLQRNDEEEAP